MNVSDSRVPSNLSDGDISLMIEFFTTKSQKLFAEIEKVKLSAALKEKELDNCMRTIQTLKMALELKANLSANEGYSRDWKWPTKTIFILKQIKRPLTAKDIIKSMEIYEEKIPEDKRTSVFTALTNLTKEGKIIREKPGSEYVYFMPDANNRTGGSLSKELEILGTNLSKQNLM